MIPVEDKIVVVTKDKNQIRWFVSDKEYWVLDRKKWGDAYLKKGIYVEDNDDERFGIKIVNNETHAFFLDMMRAEGFEVSKDQLGTYFFSHYKEDSDWWDFSNLFPVLYIDFDNQTLYTTYVEGINYEIYLPEGWSGINIDFLNDENIFPTSEKFWIKDNIDYRKILLKKY